MARCLCLQHVLNGPRGGAVILSVYDLDTSDVNFFTWHEAIAQKERNIMLCDSILTAAVL